MAEGLGKIESMAQLFQGGGLGIRMVMHCKTEAVRHRFLFGLKASVLQCIT